MRERYEAKSEEMGPEFFGHLQQMVMLQIVDNHWKDHLLSMDHLRDGIGLRGYAQKQPMQEYKRESFEMFTELLNSIQHEVMRILARVQVKAEEDVAAVDAQRRKEAPMQYRHDDAGSSSGQAEPKLGEHETYVRQGRKLGRNEPCPCGSGNKYKHCHGKLV